MKLLYRQKMNLCFYNIFYTQILSLPLVCSYLFIHLTTYCLNNAIYNFYWKTKRTKQKKTFEQQLAMTILTLAPVHCIFVLIIAIIF